MTLLSKLTGSIRIDWQRQWRSFWRGFSVVLVFGLVAVGIPGVSPSRNDHNFQALGIARDHLFDFAAWEVEAAFDKAAVALISPASYMTEQEQIQYVRDYLETIQTIQTLESGVSQIYIDPDVADPDARSADLRAERDRVRGEQA